MLRVSVTFLLAAAGIFAQNVLNCTATANPPIVRAEGISERTGDVVISCSGAQPNAAIAGNLALFLPVNVTNRIAADGTANVFLTVNGAPANVPARVTSVNAVTFNGLSFNASAQGTAELRLQNLRGNASQLVLNQPAQVLTLFASFSGGSLLTISNNQFTVGIPQPALLSNSSGRLLCTQAGSPLPDAISFSNLIRTGTAFTTTRVTEGFASAFAPLSDFSNQGADSGVRVIVKYSGFTANARLFVPDAIAGSDTDQPTAAGDLGFPASGGQYTAGRGQLLLIRVNGADAGGAGGGLAFQPPASGTVAFDSASEIALTNGSGYAVYEVVDANPAIRESAQIPAFLGLTPGGPTAATSSTVNLAPVSTIVTASQTAPLPRFLAVAPASDCTALNDCNANYFPRLVMDITSLNFAIPAGQSDTMFLPVRNGGSGVLQYSVSTSAAFLTVTPQNAVNNATIRVIANTAGLAPGTYNATVTVDAGPIAGTRTVPVTVVVSAAQTIAQPPAIRTIVNAANSAQTVLAPGSLATIAGSRLKGNAVQVTFDGIPATILFANDTQINLQVPPALAGKSTAKVIVSVDGNTSAPSAVTLADAAPAIFSGAVLNQDWSVNGVSSPAQVGSILQIFATGLPASGTITAKVHDRIIAVPYYAGPAPGLPGVQQVDVAIPDDLPAMQSYVYVCGGVVCSPAEKLWITR